MIRTRTLGDAQTHQLITSSVSAGLSTAGLMYTMAAADPEPFTKAALALAAVCVQIFGKMIGNGCGQSCILATQVVNELEPYMQQNLQNYFAQKTRTKTTQSQALALFDAVWADVVKGCSDPALGEAGRRCISERQAGGTSSWCPNCNWFTLYRDPIANDPDVQPDTPTTLVSSALHTSSNMANLILFAALALVVLL